MSQGSLFDLTPPEKNDAQGPDVYKVAYVHFQDLQGLRSFAEKVGQRILPSTRYIWFPHSTKPFEAGRGTVPKMGRQDTLFDIHGAGTASRVGWQDEWQSMPAYVQKDLKPWKSLEVVLDTRKDAEAFFQLFDLDDKEVKRHQWFWYPNVERGQFTHLRYVARPAVNPEYPVYIISKGRWESRLTSKALEKMGVPYFIAVEPQEVEQYASVIDPAKILTLPFSNLGQGSIPARNFCWEHSIGLGAKRHWLLDDNIRGFYRLHENAKIPAETGAIFRATEAFCDRYTNIGKAGFQYDFFAWRRENYPPFIKNTRVYSCMLILNEVQHRWRGRYNEDTDLSLNMMKDGWATILLYAFLARKAATMTMKGGNTDQLYAGNEYGKQTEGEEKEKDGRWQMAEALRQQHPDVTKVTWKWGRWQHEVDYSSFRKNPLIRVPGYDIAPGVDDFGMILEEVPEEERRKPKAPRERKKVEVIETAPPVDQGYVPDQLPDLGEINDLAFDFETTGLRWWKDDRPVGLAVAWRSGAQVEERYFPFAHAGGNLPEENVRSWFLDHARKAKRLSAHNSKFDLHMAHAWGLDLDGLPVYDTMHRSAILDDLRRRHGLDAVAEDYLGIGKVKGVSMRDGAGVYHASQVAEYARRDAGLVLRLMEKMDPLIQEQELQDIDDLEARVIWPVLEMERNAFPIDTELLAQWEKQSERDLLSLQMRLFALAKFKVNVDSPTDMERLFHERGLEITAHTESGRPSFATAVLQGIDDEAVQIALKLGRMADLRSKYLSAYLGQVSDDGFMRYSLNQLRADNYGTVSGRFSGSQADHFSNEGCNPQQVMSSEKAKKHYGDDYDIRRLWIPAPGKLLVAADAAQVEFRLFAHYTNSKRLLDAYAKDRKVDFHQIVTDVAVTFNQAMTRKVVKNLNFALVFGAGLQKTAEMLGVSVEEAKTFRRIYEKTFPEVAGLLRQASDVAAKRGFVRTIMGRRRRFLHGKNTHKALNAVIQGSNGDYHKLKLCEVYEERKRLGLTMRLTVHDEIVGDVEDQEGARMLHEVLERQTLTACRVPLLWDYGTGATWAEAK